jgi:hypothetical protein
MKPDSKAPSKRPYQAPKLLVYGGLTEITKTGPSGMSDKGKSGQHLT